MTFKIQLSVVFLSLLLAGLEVRAGGCRLKEVTLPKAMLSRYLAEEVRNKVLEIEKSMDSQGQELKVVMVARSGEGMDGLDLIKDNREADLQSYMDHLAQIVTESRHSDLRLSDGTVIRKSNRLQVPKVLREDRNLKYSHFGFLVKRNESEFADNGDIEVNDWIYLIDLLADCDEESNRYGQSEIFFATFDQFFWDTELLNKKRGANGALLVVPSPEVQENLFRILHDPKIAGENGGLHEPTYNVAATPYVLKSYRQKRKENDLPFYYQTQDQNSNQWPAEVLATSSKPYGIIRTRAQAQNRLWETNYRPSLVTPKGVKESLACSLRRGPLGLWDATNLINCRHQVFRPQRIMQLITVDSILDWMLENSFVAKDLNQPSKSAIYEIEVPMDKLEELDWAAKQLEKVFKRPGSEPDTY